MVGGMVLQHWADHISGIGRRLYPGWEWLTTATDADAYESFARDWEGCAIKARQVKENPKFTYGVEKRGLIFEFHVDDLRRLPPTGNERDLVLERVIRDGIDNHATLVTPGANYLTYYLGRSDVFIIGEDRYVHA